MVPVLKAFTEHLATLTNEIRNLINHIDSHLTISQKKPKNNSKKSPNLYTKCSGGDNNAQNNFYERMKTCSRTDENLFPSRTPAQIPPHWKENLNFFKFLFFFNF